jgi:hypothetical protein
MIITIYRTPNYHLGTIDGKRFHIYNTGASRYVQTHTDLKEAIEACDYFEYVLPENQQAREIIQQFLEGTR